MSKTTKQIIHAVHSWAETDFDQKWYSEDEVKALFTRLEKADISLQFEQRMMTISQGDILLIPKKDLEKIKSDFLGNGDVENLFKKLKERLNEGEEHNHE